MTSANKHKERSRRTNTGIAFRSEDKARHKLLGNMLIFNPKKPKQSRFLEDREGGMEIIAEYEKNREKKNVAIE